MASEANPDLEGRLARLAERRAAGPRPVERRAHSKRGHPAAAGRLVAAGLSTSAFFGIIATLAAQAPPSGAAAVSAPPPSANTVRSVGGAPPGSAARAAEIARHPVASGKHSPAARKRATTPSTASITRGTLVNPTAVPSPSVQYVAPSASTPDIGPTTPAAPSPSVTAPPATTRSSGPAATTPHTAPPTAPPSTAFVPPPTTVFTPPTTPSPPACTGSKCP
jgi:hypothetical protein